MKQQVDDIKVTLSGLLSELRGLRETVASQHAEICSLNRNVDRLLKENRKLRKRLEKYEKPTKDSGNQPRDRNIPERHRQGTSMGERRAGAPEGGHPSAKRKTSRDNPQGELAFTA